jgi:hypothetical protein
MAIHSAYNRYKPSDIVGENYSDYRCPQSGKRTFATRADAKVNAKRMAKAGSGNLRPYICWHCHEWHIGHPRVYGPE